MSIFSIKYFVRSHLLLAVLGGLSLFPIESHGMDPVDDSEKNVNKYETMGQKSRAGACAREKSFALAQDALIKPDDQQNVLRISVLSDGLPLQAQTACTLSLEIPSQSSAQFSSLSSRLELIRDISSLPTPEHKKKASALLLDLLENPFIWQVCYSGSPENQKEIISLLLSQSVDPLLWGTNLEARLKVIDTILRNRTNAQKETAYSILLSIAQSEDLSFKVRIEQANIVLSKGTKAQKQTAFDVLCALSDHSDISLKDRLSVAEFLIGDIRSYNLDQDISYAWNHPGHEGQAERASALLLSILQDTQSTFSQKERLGFAQKVVFNGSPDQKKAGIFHVFSIIKDSKRKPSLCAQIKPLIYTFFHADSEDSMRASDLLVSLFENPKFPLIGCEELASDLCFDYPEHHVRFKSMFEMRRRLLDSVKNFENALSFEKRLTVAEKISEHYSRNSYQHKSDYAEDAHDILLTIIEQPEAPLETRRNISRRISVQYSTVSEEQKNRAFRVHWGVLLDPQNPEDEIKDMALFLSEHSHGRGMPPGIGEVFLRLMSDPSILERSGQSFYKEEKKAKGILSAHRKIAFFVLEYGESDEQKERAGDFLNTSLLNHEKPLSDTIFSYDGLNDFALKILLLATPTQKQRVGTYLLSLIRNEQLSLENRINTAVLLMNYCIPEQRHPVANVLQTILTPERIRQVQDFILARTPIVINNFREEALSRTTRELLASMLLSYVADNTRLSNTQRRQTLEFFLNPFNLLTLDPVIDTRPLVIEARLLLEDVPAIKRPLLKAVLEVYWDDLLNIEGYYLGAMIITLGMQPSTTWQQTINETIARFRPQVRQLAAAHAPTGPQRREDERFEVHQFSSVHASHVDRSMTQHEAVMNIIDNDLLTRETSPVSVMSFVPSFEEIRNWIKTNYPDSRHLSAFHSIQAGMDLPGAEHCVSNIVSWLKRFHSDKIDVWMTGFVGESLSAYENADSCPYGVKERAISGLRGIDARIDRIFEEATKMQSAKAFIASLHFKDERNGPRNKAWLVQKLIELGVTDETSEDTAAQLFKEFGRSIIMGKGLAKTHVRRELTESFYLEQLDTFAQLMQDSYEDDFKEAIVRALKLRALAETAAGNSAVAAASIEILPSSEAAGAEERPEEEPKEKDERSKT